jgi:hypothetical protein
MMTLTFYLSSGHSDLQMVYRWKHAFAHCPVSHQIPRMFVLVAKEAKQFPVAAIRWIVVVVVILVMNGEFPHSLALEFATTSRTNRRKDFQCLLTVSPHSDLLGAPSLGNKLNPPAAVRFCVP